MGRHALEVDIADQQCFISVSPRRLRRLVRQTLQGDGILRARISLALVDGRASRRLNRRFLSHDYATDVISFRLSGDDEPLEGEVVVNAQRALGVARRRHAEPEGELFLYAVHGVLHLVGYDDAQPDDARAMHRQEEAILTDFGHPNAYWPRPPSGGRSVAEKRQDGR